MIAGTLTMIEAEAAMIVVARLASESFGPMHARSL
jgi:hypothetical protein